MNGSGESMIPFLSLKMTGFKDDDSLGQLMIAMITAQQLSSYNNPVYGAYILRTGIICAFHKLPLPAGEGWGGGSKT